jgi:hypothetical protein
MYASVFVLYVVGNVVFKLGAYGLHACLLNRRFVLLFRPFILVVYRMKKCP